MRTGTWLLLAGLVSSGSSMSQAIDSNSYLHSADQTRKYCMGGLCLGFSVAEAERIGTIRWENERPPPRQLKCTLAESMAAGELVTREGNRFRLIFTQVQAEAAGPVYRLTGMQFLAPASLSGPQLTHLFASLRDRWVLATPEREGVSYKARTPDGLSTVMLGKVDRGTPLPDSPAMLLAMSTFLHYDAWLMTVPDCRKGLPKL